MEAEITSGSAGAAHRGMQWKLLENNTWTAESIKSNGLYEGCKVEKDGTERDILASEMDGQIIKQ